MKYWLNLYTWNTWQEFLNAGGNVTGFRDRRWRTVQKIKPGDLFLCYMTGISRFFAIEEVVGEAYKDESEIWGEAVFSSRLPVRVILSLDPEYAVPVVSMRSELSFFQDLKTPHAWTGFFRGSPTEISSSDARVIIRELEYATENPIYHEFDPKKLDKKVRRYETKSGPVSIPDDEENYEVDDEVTGPTHDEIQWLLLNLGERMGLDLWVASNDRNKDFNGNRFKSLSRLRNTLPVQFDAATNRTIELIDILWLQGNSIVAAFEIEHTTSVYSGLLRMADLVTMQPNLNIPLYIVAPDERRDKVAKEINRPVFSKALSQSLPQICRYIPYSSLIEKYNKADAGGFLRYLKPEFLDEIAEDMELEDY
jgi:hypothetical protein